MKWPEHALALGGRYARAIVFHLESRPGHANGHVAAAVFDCVLHEVRHHPLDRTCVTAKHQWVVDPNFDRAIRSDQQRRQIASHTPHQRCEVYLLVIPVGVEALEIDQLFGKIGEPLDIFAEPTSSGLIRRVDLDAQDRNWRAQLVRGRGDKPPLAINRDAYCMTNWLGFADTVRQSGKLPSMFPADTEMPMVAPDDLGRAAVARLLSHTDDVGLRHVEGPVRYTPQNVANAFALTLDRTVTVDVAQRKHWGAIYKGLGFSEEATRSYVKMTAASLDNGFDKPESAERGRVTLKTFFAETLDGWLRGYTTHSRSLAPLLLLLESRHLLMSLGGGGLHPCSYGCQFIVAALGCWIAQRIPTQPIALQSRAPDY